jgi:hypothetical protein
LNLRKTKIEVGLIKVCKDILQNLDYLNHPKLGPNSTRKNITNLRDTVDRALLVGITSLKQLFEKYRMIFNESNSVYRILENVELTSFDNVNHFKAETINLRNAEDIERLRRIVNALLVKLQSETTSSSAAALSSLVEANETYRTSFATSEGGKRHSKRHRKQRRRHTRRQK